jgi:hypothetical protein
VDIGSNPLDQRGGGISGEHDHGIDRLKGGEQLGSFMSWNQRTTGPLETLYRRVVVDGDD